MDPLTHALIGAGVAFAVRPLDRRVVLAGAAAALLPDIDVFIRSASDPLLAIEHHRGFTHSLAFTPIGGLITALIIGRSRWQTLLLPAIAAYLSHPLLDAATTYGTRLFWPFSRMRVGLDVISIIDPIFTLIALAGFIAAWKGRRPMVSIALILALAWLAGGLVQRNRALNAQQVLAATRGQTVARGEVFPTIGNTIVWRSVYEHGGVVQMDRIRTPWFGRPHTFAVTALPLVHAEAIDARARDDFARFAWFSSGWVARAPSQPDVIGDARYSLRNDAYEPVWGIRVGPDGRVDWVNRTRERRMSLGELWSEIFP